MASKPVAVLVGTHCPVRNWAEKRLYEPLRDTHSLHAVFWDRRRLWDAHREEEARAYGIVCYPYEGTKWGLSHLGRYYRHILKSLDVIPYEDSADCVIPCDLDVLPAVVWHRITRRRRYRILREEVDYYSGCRFRGRGLKDRLIRFAIDAAEALLHTQCDGIFTLNRHARARITGWGVPERKVAITGLWKKDEFFADDHEAGKRRLLEEGVLSPEQLERLKGRIIVSFYGLFYEFTHLRELLDTVSKFPDQFALLLAGFGHDQPMVEDFARRCPNILFLGWKDEDELKAFYKITDIVYQPLNPDENINWKYFGSTNKTFESLAAGCLFIGSAINERVDLNREAEFALLIDFSRDVQQQIEELFRAILADRSELTRRQRNARKLFDRYNHAHHVRIWKAMIEEPR